MNQTLTNSNEFITISKLMGKEIVGSSVCLSSSFEKAKHQIICFAEVLKNVKVEQEGLVKVREEHGSIYGSVDGMDVIKFSHHPLVGWMVATSVALPRSIALAKSYVQAMGDAYDMVINKTKNKIHETPKYQINVHVSEKPDFDIMNTVIKGSINDKDVYVARLVGDKWSFNIAGEMVDDFEWMLAFENVIKNVNQQCKRIKC